MRFSPVCPIHIYEALAAKGPEYIGDYFLLLAHDVLANAERYAALFRSDALAGSTIIMDNSVIELGSACTAQNLLEAANIVGADVVVIPDVLEDGDATIEAAVNFMQQWLYLSDQHHFKTQLMFVPQGHSISDYHRCFESIADEYLDKIDWIGIARNLTGRLFPTRRMAVGYIDAYLCASGKHTMKIHMLGYSGDTFDDITTCTKFPNLIEGIDSAVPLRAMWPLVESRLGITGVGPRGDWWDEVQMTPTIAHNVITTRRMLKEIR